MLAHLIPASENPELRDRTGRDRNGEPRVDNTDNNGIAVLFQDLSPDSGTNDLVVNA